MCPTLCFLLQSHTHQLLQQFVKSQLDQQIKIIATTQTSKHSCNYCVIRRFLLYNIPYPLFEKLKLFLCYQGWLDLTESNRYAKNTRHSF